MSRQKTTKCVIWPQTTGNIILQAAFSPSHSPLSLLFSLVRAAVLKGTPGGHTYVARGDLEIRSAIQVSNCMIRSNELEAVGCETSFCDGLVLWADRVVIPTVQETAEGRLQYVSAASEELAQAEDLQ